MVDEEHAKANDLQDEKCDTEYINELDTGDTNGIKEANASINAIARENRNGNMEEAAFVDANSTLKLFPDNPSTGQRHKRVREAKILETSIANLKRKLQRQNQSSYSASASTVSESDWNSAGRCEETAEISGSRAPHRSTSEESPVENDDNSDDSYNEVNQTAVERSLAAMSRSRALNAKCSTSSRNSLNDVNLEEDDDHSRCSTFLDALPGVSDADSNTVTAFRKKRQRRNPVWSYFTVQDGVATCTYCSYSTKSVFSTNLKVHLRTHHHDLFEEVMKAEDENQGQQQETVQVTSSAPAGQTPFMHRVTTTALPAAFGNGTTSSNEHAANNAQADVRLDLNNALALLKILNQSGSLHTKNALDTVVSPSSNTVNLSSTVSFRNNSRPKPKNTLLESQLPVDDGKLAGTNRNKNLPDILKLISEVAKTHPTAQQFVSPKALGTTLTEALKAVNKNSQKTPLLPQFDMKFASGGNKTHSSAHNNQSPVVLKRRRLRRHPVWRFFKDVGGDGSKTVKCINCSFSTSSPFSTNLKMHLKAHHKSDYRLILILESRQRLEEGISPVPEPVPTSPVVANDECNNEEANVAHSSAGGENKQLNESQKSTSATNSFEEEIFTAMTNTERVKAMIELAAANRAKPSVDSNDLAVDCIVATNTNGATVSGSDPDLDLVDTSLLMRLGLAKPESLSSNQKDKFLNPQSAKTGNITRNQMLSTTTNLDTTKSVRTVSKRLPTGEVVKVRQTRKCSDLPITSSISTCTTTPSYVAAATATINTTTPIVPSRDLMSAVNLDNQIDRVKADQDLALAKLLQETNAFHLLTMPKFKQFVELLNPTYQLPDSGYLKQLLEFPEMLTECKDFHEEER